ncbi:MAG: hypothetical protein U9R03_02265, partial [Candidatus Aerophobetes bacterium]|nr:hypothetical protein [Candidatus Aerophobetes bacterium]
MAGLVLILTFILSISFAACTFPGTSNFSSLKENKSQVVKFGISISNRPINQKYSLAFTMEPAEKDLPLRKGKVAVGTKTRTRVRIILDIPKGVKDEKEKPVLISFVQKSRDTGGMSTFQTTGRGDLPMEAKLILKDLSSKTLDAVQFKVLGEWKENDENSGNLQTSVEKQFGINESRFYTEPAILEPEMSTGSFCSSVVTILNEEAQPLHIKGYLHYILVKSSPSSFSSQESKGYSSDS